MTFVSIINFISAHYTDIIAAIVGVLSALIGVFMIIPGDQPEKLLQAIVDFLKKFSVKP